MIQRASQRRRIRLAIIIESDHQVRTHSEWDVPFTNGADTAHRHESVFQDGPATQDRFEGDCSD
jgi:hypothetical protein